MPIYSWIITLHVDVSYFTVYVFICELYECEIKLNSLDKFSVDSHFKICLKSVEWFGRWSMQPNMTFPLCIYFMHLVERTHIKVHKIFLIYWNGKPLNIYYWGVSKD